MLKMYLLAGIRGSLAVTGSDEGGPTGKCRSVRSRPPPIHCHEQEPDHVLLFLLRAASLTSCQTETDPIPDQVQVLAQEVYAIDLLPLLANNLHRLDFEVTAPALCIQFDNIGLAIN